MFPRIFDRVIEWVKAHKQFGLEFGDRGSHTWLFVRTWRRDSFYRVAVGVIDRYHGDASSELVILGQVLCAVGNGASLVSISGWSHILVELQGLFGKRMHARSVGLPDFWRQVAEALPTKNCPHCVRDARSLFDERIHRNETESWWASRLDAVETILAKGDWDRWPLYAWASGCCEQHHWSLAAHCLLPQREWQERQRR